jgi:hypothetical protein
MNQSTVLRRYHWKLWLPQGNELRRSFWTCHTTGGISLYWRCIGSNMGLISDDNEYQLTRLATRGSGGWRAAVACATWGVALLATLTYRFRRWCIGRLGFGRAAPGLNSICYCLTTEHLQMVTIGWLTRRLVAGWRRAGRRKASHSSKVNATWNS